MTLQERQKKKKTYVLMVSERFPSTHSRKGQPTRFVSKINLGEKIHTIRGNYDLWEKRIAEINKGSAILSVRVWTGTPYQTPQHEVFTFEKVGIQKLSIDDYLYSFQIDTKRVYGGDVSKNDGLTDSDFSEWFKKAKDGEEYAVIHFTDFRY